MNFAKFRRTPFLTEHLFWLLLNKSLRLESEDIFITVLFRMATKKARYKKQWENAEIYPEFSSWITSVPSEPSSARCKFCKGIQ